MAKYIFVSNEKILKEMRIMIALKLEYDHKLKEAIKVLYSEEVFYNYVTDLIYVLNKTKEILKEMMKS